MYEAHKAASSFMLLKKANDVNKVILPLNLVIMKVLVITLMTRAFRRET